VIVDSKGFSMLNEGFYYPAHTLMYVRASCIEPIPVGSNNAENISFILEERLQFTNGRSA
jgi:hypothetical protein